MVSSTDKLPQIMQKQNHKRLDFDSIGEQKSNKKIYFF